MMPRSDKAYVMLTVAACSIVVLVSVVGVILALTGDQQRNPEYESAPAPSLIRLPPDNIVDTANALRPPISDAEFLLFHRTTRLLSRALLAADWDTLTRDHAVRASALAAVRNDLQTFRALVRGLTVTRGSGNTVNVARPVNGRARSSSTVEFVGTDDQGNPIEPVLVAFTFYWSRNANREWAIDEISPSITGGATTTSDGAGTGDGGGTTEEPDDDASDGTVGGEPLDPTGELGG